MIGVGALDTPEATTSVNSPSTPRSTDDASDGSEARAWTSREKFAFRWAVLFFRSYILLWLSNYILPAIIAEHIGWFHYLSTDYPIPAKWFQDLWPPCPGCDYDPM